MGKQEEAGAETEQIVDPSLELEQYKQSLVDWGVWAETKTAEYDQLMVAYNQYVEAYDALQTELSNVQQQKEEKEVAWSELAEELREKNEEIACFKSTVEALEQEKKDKDVSWSGLAEELRQKKEEFHVL